MQKSLLAGALCAATFGFVCAPVHAQTAPVAGAPAADVSGTDLLLQARELLETAGPNGSPSAAEELAPAENLRRQRLAVARNAPALAKVRAALAAGIAAPAPVDGAMPDFGMFAATRELARQFAQEADVRAADGDALGAANSSLDSLELAAQTGNGSLIQWLVGSAVSSIARKYLVAHAPQLDAAQTRAVITRLAVIEATQPTIEAVLRGEAKVALASARMMIEDPRARAEMQADLLKPDDDKLDYSHAQIRAMLALTTPQLEANIDALFKEATMRAVGPYQAASRLPALTGADPLTKQSALLLDSIRFGFERDELRLRLIRVALQLRLAKLESGQYPATFDAGADPFSPDLAPLVYQRMGESYVLYSVGPDGADNGGTSVGNRVRPDSTGDVIAPVL